MSYPADFIPAIQRRVARVAVGPSATRGQHAPGLTEAARAHLATVDLRCFGITDAEGFVECLDDATGRLKRALPRAGRSFGIARKLLNIFLRDALYTVYLRSNFYLDVAEHLLEIPLDSITAKRLRQEAQGVGLPRWRGVKHLTPSVSKKYQDAAQSVASRYSVARVHLDAYWWAGPRTTGPV